MLQKSVYSLIFFCVLLYSGHASAQATSVSYGIYLGSVDYEASGDPEVTVSSYALKSSLHFFEGISFELRGGMSTSESETSSDGSELNLEADYFVSAYVRDTRAMTNNLDWYVILGYSQAKFSGTVTSDELSVNAEHTQHDWSYGMGFSYKFAGNYAANIEWKQIVKGEDFEMSGIAIGLDLHY